MNKKLEIIHNIYFDIRFALIDIEHKDIRKWHYDVSFPTTAVTYYYYYYYY